MKLIEFRIFMPLTIEENLIGQLWSFAEVSRVNTGGGEGVKIARNENFEVKYDANGHVIFDMLPFYESYEAQHDDGNQTNGSTSSSSSSSSSATKSLKNVFKKSASKENFQSNKHKHSAHANHERRKSLDSMGDSAVLSTTAVELKVNDAKAKNCTVINSNQETTQAESDSNNNRIVRNGQFTHKHYMIASKLPWFVRKLLSKESTIIHEKSWNMYPQVKTVLTNDFFKQTARIELDTITRVVVDGKPDENVHNLTPEQLEKREIVVIDISEPVPSNEYKEDEDPTLFKSVKTGRGPLIRGEWYKTQKPLICCYKLVFAEFKVFGLQSRAESYLKTMYKQLFTSFHRQIFCWIDKWYGLTLEEVRKIEEELAKQLIKKIDEGELSKNKLGETSD